ncbi:MAG: hypothetical protein ACTHMD_17590 [Flavisolibacter sp.]
MSFLSRIKLLTFLKDKHKSYELNFPVAEVFNAINNIPQSVGLWSTSNIMLKYFDGKDFTIQLIRLNASVNSPRLASKLFGEIEKRTEVETIIRTTLKCSPGTYISFFICILTGLIFLGKLLFFHGDIVNLLWAILMLGVFPYLLSGFKNVSDIAITENFEEYLSKELKK